MKNRTQPLRLSQILSVTLFALAVVIMVAPFRSDNTLTRMKGASMLPILSTASLAHGVSFQARGSVERVWTSEGSQFRSPLVAKNQLVPRREIVVRKVAGAVPEGWGEPRTMWKHLSKQGRQLLDGVAALGGREVQVRDTGTLAGDVVAVERMRVALGLSKRGDGGAAVNLVLGNGQGATDGSINGNLVSAGEGGAVVVYMVADFHRQPATSAQWEALDEVLDYLEMKWGRVKVSLPGTEGGGLGPLFPVERFWRALAETDA